MKALRSVLICMLCMSLILCGCANSVVSERDSLPTQSSQTPSTSDPAQEDVPPALPEERPFADDASNPKAEVPLPAGTQTTQPAAQTQTMRNDAQTTAKPTEKQTTQQESQTQTTLPPKTQTATQPQPTQGRSETVRAVWISYLEIASMNRRSASSFRTDAQKMMRNIRAAGLNTVFLQVRPACDAMYRSSVFPYSAYISGVEGKDPGYDALDIFCACANEENVSLHAWINPFRVGNASNVQNKASSGPAMKILRDDDPANDSRIVNVNGSLYFDPADAENQQLILDGVRELLQKYPIAGVHIDDYFYPSTSETIDQKDYDAYLASGGTSGRSDWRRTQINLLVSRLHTCVKSFGENKIFSISPSMEIGKNRNTLYADVERWAANTGYCDWLIPQVYVGFEHQTHPFRETVRQWLSLRRSANVRLIFGLAAYKCGEADAYAGSGRNEWVDHTDILARQIRFLRETDGSYGFALFSYSYAFGEKMSDNSKLEMKSVMDML